MANKEWFKINVTGKQTDHRFAPDIVTAIQTVLRKYGVPNHEVTFDAWGDEPPATPRRIDKLRRGG